MPDRIIIRIPASTPHIGLVRAMASALAALQDFTYDRITDLHIAIDEVCSRILATSGPGAGRIEVAFSVREDGLKIEARGDSPMRPGTAFLTPWSRAILDSVTQGLDVTTLDRVTCASFLVPRGS